MAIPPSSKRLPRLCLELEHNCDQRPWDSYPLRNELTAVLEKIEARQYSKDKPLDFAEEIALDWKQVANDDPEISRWLNGPWPSQTETNYFPSRLFDPDISFGSELSSVCGPVSEPCSSGLQPVTYTSYSTGSCPRKPPTSHQGERVRLEGTSCNSSLNPQQEHHQSHDMSQQHCGEIVSLAQRTWDYTAPQSGYQDHRRMSNARSSEQRDTTYALQGYSSAASNSQTTQNREYISHRQKGRHYAASPYPPPPCKRLLTTQTDTPSILPVIDSSFALSISKQQSSENPSLGQTTSDYGSLPNPSLPSTMDHSSPTAKKDLMSYDHKAFCELVKTARERANISQERLASILCKSYGAKFPNARHSIQRFRSRLYGDNKMNSLYLIFKAWLDDVDTNASAPRDTSTTKLRSGRACKQLSEDQYAVLTDEFAQDHWPSQQKLAELASSLAVRTETIRKWFKNQRARKNIRWAPRTQRGVECGTSKSRDSQDQRVKDLMEIKRILLKSLSLNDKYLDGDFPEIIGNLFFNNHYDDGYLYRLKTHSGGFQKTYHTKNILQVGLFPKYRSKLLFDCYLSHLAFGRMPFHIVYGCEP